VALAAALPDLEVVGGDVVRLPRRSRACCSGSGKVEELKALIEAE
jgi:GTP-binding protein HflX